MRACVCSLYVFRAGKNNLVLLPFVGSTHSACSSIVKAFFYKKNKVYVVFCIITTEKRRSIRYLDHAGVI